VKQAQKLCLIKYPLDAEQPLITNKDKYPRVYYIRYANDFLIGVKGPKELAMSIRQDAIQFLQADLHLEVNLANLTHAKENKVQFVGFDIKVSSEKETSVSRLKDCIAFSKLRNRIKMRKRILENR